MNQSNSDIHSLPTEMVEKVLDQLSFRDRQNSSLVCRQWQQMLAHDRLLGANTILCVRPSTLTSDWALQRMQRPFQAMVISSEGLEAGSAWEQFANRVHRLLSSAPVRSALRSLRVCMSVLAANHIFGQKQTIQLPHLQEVFYSPAWMIRDRAAFEEETDPLINVYAPVLHTLRIVCINASCVELMIILAPKVKRMELGFYDKYTFLAAMAYADYVGLRELMIEALPCEHPGEKIFSTDLNGNFGRNLERLTTLNIRDRSNLFALVYHLVFRAAINLTHLDVDGVDMHPLALHALNDIVQLKALKLMVASNYHHWRSEMYFNLPELEVLLLSPKLMARAGYVPKLQRFSVYNHREPTAVPDEYAIEALLTYSTVSSIKILRLRDILLSEEVLQAVSCFRTTPQIVLEDIRDHVDVLCRIGNSYSRLALLTLVRCEFSVVEWPEDVEWDEHDPIGPDLQINSLEQLDHMFPYCRLDIRESVLWRHTGSEGEEILRQREREQVSELGGYLELKREE